MTTATATTMTNRTKTTEIPTNEAAPAERRGRPESELRAAARKKGFIMKELAALMGVSASHLSQVGTGKKPWTPNLREKAIAMLGEVPGQGVVHRQNDVINGESTFIRERARALGMTMQDLSDRSGVSYSYLTQVARGRSNMGVKVQTRIGVCPGRSGQSRPRKARQPSGRSDRRRRQQLHPGVRPRSGHDHAGAGRECRRVLQLHEHGGQRPQKHGREGAGAGRGCAWGGARVAAAQCPDVDRQFIWEQMDDLNISQNEVARRAGISSAHLSQIMNGKSTPSAVVLRKLHGALFQQTQDPERVMPVALKVLAREKGERSDMVVHGQGRRGAGRRSRALGRRGGVRLPRQVRRHREGVGGPLGRAGLLRTAQAAGGGNRVRETTA